MDDLLNLAAYLLSGAMGANTARETINKSQEDVMRLHAKSTAEYQAEAVRKLKPTGAEAQKIAAAMLSNESPLVHSGEVLVCDMKAAGLSTKVDID